MNRLPEDHPAAWINDYPGQFCVCPYSGAPCSDCCYLGLACDQIREVLEESERSNGTAP